MAEYARALCWIRRDLRLSDHAALTAATRAADQVFVAFMFDTTILDALPDREDRRVWFIHQSLQELHDNLKGGGAGLIVRHGVAAEEIPNLAKELAVGAVFTGEDYDPYAIARDRVVRNALANDGIDFISVSDITIRRPDEVRTQSGGDFRVFTPYSRAWRAMLQSDQDLAPLEPDLSKVRPGPPESELKSIETYGFRPTDLWLAPGESAAKARLDQFVPKIGDYDEQRNYPAVSGTSGLSVHLRFGTISVRQCVRRAWELGANGDKWVTELIWREFYQALLFNYPHVTHRAFRPEYAGLEWPGEDDHFQAWCAGQTGYPIVDAAMRCLNKTGWMHNRLRMIVASFLTKDLLIDWRRGEHYFAVKLLDFELASNNGGWQWAASTGADSQPYFRIFNPLLQSEKFDEKGAFIRQWIPELAAFDSRTIHDPWSRNPLEAIASGYPRPIVDHATQKARALKLLSSVRETPV
jgi:deoxyribodipyrimidine photo-lyase